MASRYLVDLATTVMIYVMLGWGLNVVVGLAGLLDLGYVAFYAVGAYSFAIFAQWFRLGFWEALPLAGLLAGVVRHRLGFPVLRLRGDYLAIVTLGFGEIVRIMLLNWVPVTGGPAGIGDVPRADLLRHAVRARARRRASPPSTISSTSLSMPASASSFSITSSWRSRSSPISSRCACGGCRSAAPGRRCARTRSPAARSASTRPP